MIQSLGTKRFDKFYNKRFFFQKKNKNKQNKQDTKKNGNEVQKKKKTIQETCTRISYVKRNKSFLNLNTSHFQFTYTIMEKH